MRESVVYFLLSGSAGLVKIGTTIDLTRRMTELRRRHEPRFRLLGSVRGNRKHERAWHERFRHLHATGEWFIYPGELSRAIDAALTARGIWHCGGCGQLKGEPCCDLS